MVGWSLLTDFDAIKRAGVPILRSLNIRFRLKQQAHEQGILQEHHPSLSGLYWHVPRCASTRPFAISELIQIERKRQISLHSAFQKR
jgi:hypothetical protein